MEQTCAALLKQASCPVVFTELIDHWPSKKWTPTNLAQVLEGKKYRCKLAPRKCKDQVWETDCAHIEASLSEFCEWTSGEIRGDNPLSHISPDHFSCYVDYKYMPQMFEDCRHMLKSVDWSVFGLSDRDGHDSTIWIGSEGASTPCHYDTYGFNLVAQIYGRKRWHLFPPSSSECLYPTRLPYEESSVFSEVNVCHPDLLKTPHFKHSRAVVVTLEPGQVLYVPRHWWHYVECLETAVSINTWVELVSDDESRLSESITRATVSCLMSSGDGESLQEWLNPNEDIMAMDVNWTYLQKCLQKVVDKRIQSGTNKTLDIDNLQKFGEHFQGSHFSFVDAPWNIPIGRHLEDQDTDNSDGPGDVLNQGEPCHQFRCTVSGKRKYFHNQMEESSTEEDRKKDGSSKRLHLCPDSRSSDSDSLDGASQIFVLKPSTFATYFKLVHGVVQWNNLNVCDNTSGTMCDRGLASSEGHHQGFTGAACDESKREKVVNAPMKIFIQEKADSRAVSQSEARRELLTQQHGDSITGPELTTTEANLIETDQDEVLSMKSLLGKGRDTLVKCDSGCEETVEKQDSSDIDRLSFAGSSAGREDSGDVTVDLSAVRDMFFKSLLHPRVVKVMAEQLVSNFELLKK